LGAEAAPEVLDDRRGLRMAGLLWHRICDKKDKECRRRKTALLQLVSLDLSQHPEGSE
jgi:hypothetical protein